MTLPSNGKQNEHFLYHQHGSLHEHQLKILDIARNKVMSISPQIPALKYYTVLISTFCCQMTGPCDFVETQH